MQGDDGFPRSSPASDTRFAAVLAVHQLLLIGVKEEHPLFHVVQFLKDCLDRRTGFVASREGATLLGVRVVRLTARPVVGIVVVIHAD